MFFRWKEGNIQEILFVISHLLHFVSSFARYARFFGRKSEGEQEGDRWEDCMIPALTLGVHQGPGGKHCLCIFTFRIYLFEDFISYFGSILT